MFYYNFFVRPFSVLKKKGGRIPQSAPVLLRTLNGLTKKFMIIHFSISNSEQICIKAYPLKNFSKYP